MLIHMGQATRAVAEARLAVHLCPSPPNWALLGLGEAYRISGRPDDAAAVLQVLCGRRPNRFNLARARVGLALVLASRGEDKDAAALITQARDAFPGADLAWFRRVFAYKNHLLVAEWAATVRLLGMPDGSHTAV